ncbi:MAG TPA: metal-dependent hydrolase, partial [Bryobacteraceae bacterium]|nr:metal-dependent hydrolase [Bryobacteraceae bacterium]
MDNVTHSLTGFALARAGLDRWCPRATLLLLLSANAPDCDIVALTRGQLAYLEAHRGYTHSLLLLPVMALLCVVVTAALYRERLPWFKAWLVCLIGVSSHLLLDWTLTYGVRPFIPFSSRWFHLDWNALYDWNILLVLAIAALWPLFSRLVSGEIGDRSHAGRGIARFALVFLVLFDGARATLHARAVEKLESRLYDDLPPMSVAALPLNFNPFRWNGIVETAGAYRTFLVDTFNPLDADNATIYYKPPMTGALENAQREEPFRYFLYFARFPVWSQQPVIWNE